MDIYTSGIRSLVVCSECKYGTDRKEDTEIFLVTPLAHRVTLFEIRVIEDTLKLQ